MRKISQARQNGFTLVEMLISVAIFLVILLGIYEVFDTNRTTYFSGRMRANAQQTTRLALNEMVRQLRMAGYFPENFSATPPSPLLTNPIQIATNNALAFYGDPMGTGTSTITMFCLSGTSLLIVQGNAGVPATFNCTTANPTNGDLLAENITRLKFTYYDANGNTIPNPLVATFQLDGQSPGALPSLAIMTQRGAVHSVAISLATTAPQTTPGLATQVYTLTSAVRLRNIN